jgi:hypothetical protein
LMRVRPPWQPAPRRLRRVRRSGGASKPGQVIRPFGLKVWRVDVDHTGGSVPPRADHRVHRPRADRFWCRLVRDRALAPSSDRQRASPNGRPRRGIGRYYEIGEAAAEASSGPWLGARQEGDPGRLRIMDADGQDVRAEPLEERRTRLATLLPATPVPCETAFNSARQSLWAVIFRRASWDGSEGIALEPRDTALLQLGHRHKRTRVSAVISLSLPFAPRSEWHRSASAKDTPIFERHESVRVTKSTGGLLLS